MNRCFPAKVLSACALLLWVTFSARAQGDAKAIDDYNFAAWLYNSGKYGLATESYQNFLKNYPGDAKEPDARFGLAQSLFHQDRHAEAAQEYEKLRSSARDFPQMPEVLFQLAQSRIALNQFGDAEKLLSEFPTRFPQHYLADWAVARRAACLISLNKPVEAEQLLDPFLAKYAVSGTSPGKVQAVRDMLAKLEQAGVKAGDAFLGLVERSVFYKALAQFNGERFADAQKSFEVFLRDYPKSALLDEAGFRLAQSFYRQNKFVEAAAAYAPVAAGSGEFAEAAGFERGLSLHKAGRLKEASAAFAEAARRFPAGPRAAKARLYAGTCLFDAGDYAGAEQQLRPLAEARKDLADEAAYWIGMSRLKAGKSAEAEDLLGKALQDFQQSSLASDMQLGLADARLAQDKLTAAAEAFLAYARKAPQAEQAPRALYSAGVALHRADQYAASDEACGSLLKQFPASGLVPQALFLSGENRFLRKDYGAAAKRYRELLERKDTPADRAANAHYRLAWIHRYAKRCDAAVEELGMVDLKAASKTVAAEASYLKGVCLFETGRYGEAAEALRAYLKSDDHSRFGDDAQLKLAVSEVRQNRKKDALQAFQQFLRDYPRSELAAQARYQLAECAYDLKDYGQAIENYKHLMDREQPDDLSPYAMLGYGLCCYDQEKWSEAAAAFSALAAKFKSSDLLPQARYREGKSLMKLGKWAEAEQAFRAVAQAAPKHELARPAQMAVGTCLQEQKKWAEAAEAFKAVIAAYGGGADEPRVLYEQAWSLREAGKPAESLAAFESLAEKFPKDALAADAFFYLAEARYSASARDNDAPEAAGPGAAALDGARGLYEKVLAVGGDQRLADKALYRIGWCYWLTAKYKEAAASFDRLGKEYPASDLAPDALFQAGQAFARAGDAERAADRLQNLIGNPKAREFAYLPAAYVALAENRLLLGRPDDAVKSVRAMLDRYGSNPSAAQAYLVMGKAQYGQKQYDDALASFKAATERARGEIAAQAQFYAGQVHQAREDYKTAVLDYLRVQALYPEQREWVAAATFECAKCYEALGQKDEAVKALRNVVEDFKDTQWAKLAAERMK